jgi:hypothetical protein
MAAKITLTDEYGSLHEFEVFPIPTRFNSVAGVYCFANEASNAWEIQYIGESDSFKNRIDDNLMAHHRYQCAISRGATHFFVKVVPDKDIRIATETALRHYYEPPCNRQ